MSHLLRQSTRANSRPKVPESVSKSKSESESVSVSVSRLIHEARPLTKLLTSKAPEREANELGLNKRENNR